MTDPLPPPGDESDAVQARYARRPLTDDRYRLLNPPALLAFQERQRALVRLLVAHGLVDLAVPTVLEVGSGGGGNLLELLQLGFTPGHLSGVELVGERHAAARACLPASVELTLGDATSVPLAAAPYDVVYQSTVFSSLLDDRYQQHLADVMWAAVKPGGGVLWYDFVVGNPRNPDVRGVPLARVRTLFPAGRIDARRMTLAPPVARAACRLHPSLYCLLVAIPPLRTHLLAWITKPA
jgi:SAM-dependent methyltransferase